MTHDRITIDPNVMFGKPVIKGTRITVEHVLRKLSGGKAPEAVANDHPHLTVEDVYAALAYAADYMAFEDVLPAEPTR